MGKKTSEYRLKTAMKTDERIRFMDEIIGGIQVIKMYTWERPFSKIMEIMRRLELREIQKSSILYAVHTSFTYFLTKILIFSCILTYVFTGNTLNAQYVYGLSLFYELLRQCASEGFSQGITKAGQAIISTRRIKDFLFLDELKSESASAILNTITSTINTGGSLEPSASSKNSSKHVGISLENVSTKWIKPNTEYSLKGTNFHLASGQLATIIGKVGSGKSTLLHVLLKELPPLTGTVNINGTISYAAQEPWLFVGSVRQNILFGQDYDKVKYSEVIRVCALETDLKLFPYGDQTIIGERGVSLSGGQRGRINLARTIYKDADIYLLDDPLSAVDAHVGKHIFEECVVKFLKEKCIVLVTHQLQYLRECKMIYLLHDGKVEKTGTYNDIKNAASLAEELKKTEHEVGQEVEDVKKMNETISAEKANVSYSNMAQDTVSFWTAIRFCPTLPYYFLSAGHFCKILFLLFIFIVSQILAGSIDYFLSFWVNYEESEEGKSMINKIKITFTSFHDLLLSILNKDQLPWIYIGLIAITTPLMIGRAILFFIYCINASFKLHNVMFSKIVYAPMRFFNLNPSGRILNRFSKDMNSIDEYLPWTFSDFVQISLMVLTILILVATAMPFILIPTGIILLIFYFLRTVYVATSRNIKRFEATRRSPVYSHLTASLQGLTTIRSAGAQDLVKKEFDNYQNSFSSCSFMFYAAARCLGYWMDLHTALFVMLVTFSFLVLKIDSFGGSVGMAITQSINLAGAFRWGIRQWSEMENTMTAVERVREYAEITPESDSEVIECPKEWPVSGAVTFENVCLRYASDEPFVLKNLNISIKSTEKVGIVGRTGAGKTSIIAALFRLADIDGKILFDGIDSKTISLNRLRSSISIIPQEPVLFSGTLRKNLDPFNEYSDEILWKSLDEVQFKQVVSDLKHGLDSRVSEGGSNFSVGQRQLICLARTIIRQNKILVLDEATASIDPHTDNLIQTTIRKRYADCTVLTIAHRLHTVMDSDKVLVMDAGKVMEFDHPYVLLQDNASVFYSLVQQTGGGMAATLMDIAAKTFQSHEE